MKDPMSFAKSQPVCLSSVASFGFPFKAGTRAFFIHGFAKNEQDNINDDELAAFKKLAAEMLNYKDAKLTEAVNKNKLTEITCNEQTIP
ncbi:MAG: hypothetical protein EPN17_00750 [Methylobacter sp.]|nr:MAG: hypothetical protein EPN17_00750 [Methylobacter sp.]